MNGKSFNKSCLLSVFKEAALMFRRKGELLVWRKLSETQVLRDRVHFFNRVLDKIFEVHFHKDQLK